jgi:type IV fimbrial biogenesis protein FimT
MHPIILRRNAARGQPWRPAAGFTTVELLVAVTILALLLGVGVPAMSAWTQATKANAVAEFYAEGFRQARAEALRHNSNSRIMLTENANGRLNWQIDICYPVAAPCTEISTNWSTTTTNATGDPEGANGFKSILRRADGLAGTSLLTHTIAPLGNTDSYYTPLGWIDPTIDGRVEAMVFTPVVANAFPSSAVVITLAGVATKCDPTMSATHDARKCPLTPAMVPAL